VASYHTNVGHFSLDRNYFASSGFDNGLLHALQNGVSGTNGVFAYGSTSSFPVNSYQASNYWVDVLFVPGSVPPAIATSSLPNAAVNAAYSTTLSAVGGTSPYTWAVIAGNLPPGFVLNSSTGEISGAPTTTGNWTFTVRVTDAQAVSATKQLSLLLADGLMTIWPNTAVPTYPDAGADSPVELGFKFRSDSNGYVSGIRFYKHAANTGVHIGNLWSSSGQLLATATFTNETSSGWQEVRFSTPVAVTANSVYVASYHANGGHFSVDRDYFASSGANNGVLHALQDGESGSNGVYAYGSGSTFPTNSYQRSHYWVDIVFTPSSAP
jgi:hypothetical protein